MCTHACARVFPTLTATRELNDSRRSLWCEGMSQSRASCPTLIFTAAALRRASRRFYHPENAPCSGMHVPSERRDVNNAATLSAGECRAARGGKVLKREVDGKGVGGELEQIFRVAERTVRDNAGHLSTAERREYRHTRTSGGKKKKTHLYAQTQ